AFDRRQGRLQESADDHRTHDLGDRILGDVDELPFHSDAANGTFDGLVHKSLAEIAEAPEANQHEQGKSRAAQRFRKEQLAAIGGSSALALHCRAASQRLVRRHGHVFHQPACHRLAPASIRNTRSGNSRPAAFAAMGTRLWLVMPGTVFTSRTWNWPFSSAITSTRPQPSQPRLL